MKKVISLAIIFVLTLLIIQLSQYKQIFIIDDEGYAIRNTNISQNLNKETLNDNEKSIDNFKFNSYDVLYQQYNKRFIGEDKNIINDVYPLYINKNTTLVNINESSILIDDNFKKYSSQEIFKINNGKIYDANTNENIDNNNYIFLKTFDSMYINLHQIIISTQVNEYEIKLNSIINFSEDYIALFQPNKSKLEYHRIDDIDNKTEITINNIKYSYKEFIEKLNSISSKEIDDITEHIELDNNEENSSNDNLQNIEDEDKSDYIKPNVTIDNFKENVYQISANIGINDPAGRITDAIVVDILEDNKVFLKRKYTSSGNITITGLKPSTKYNLVATFRYKNEDNKIKEVTIANYEFKTHDLSELNSIDISFENGDIYTNQVNIKNVKINNSVNDQVLKGIKKITLKLNDKIYNLKNKEILDLINGKSIDILSEKNIESNTQVEYQFVIYDLFGNELIVDNSKGNTYTSKEKPSVDIDLVENNVTSVKLKININNKDEVDIKNLKYKLFDINGNLVDEDNINDNLEINLDKIVSDEIYTIKVYADYDLNDNNGIIYEEILGENTFTTRSISSLGFLRLNVTIDEITSNSVNLKVKISDGVDYRLVKLLSKIKYNIYTKDEKVSEYEINDFTNKNSNMYYGTIVNDELNKLKNGEEINITINNLESKQKYYIDFSSIATQLNNNYEQEAFNTLKTFTTYKKDAEVVINNLFVTENMIDFDSNLIDVDGAVINGYVTMEIRNDKNQLISKEVIEANKDAYRYTFEKLEKEKNYTITFIADSYNIGDTNVTQKSNYELKKLVVNTKTGIYGNIQLNSLTYRSTNKNLLTKEKQNFDNWDMFVENTNFTDISYNKNTNENVFKLTTTGNWEQIYTPISVTRGRTYTISFKFYNDSTYKAGNYNTGKGALHILKTKPTNANPNTNTYLNDTKSTVVIPNNAGEYSLVTLTFTAQNDVVYLDFNFGGIADNQKNLLFKVKDIQLEEADESSEYLEGTDEKGYVAEINSNIYDTNHETDLNYYIRIYKNNEFEIEHEYIMDNDYKKENLINLYSLEKDKTYRIEICVKIRRRYYVIDKTEFTTEQEIYGIKNTDDFFAMNAARKYIVLNDLDFSNINKSYATAFTGEIDFDGRTVTLNVQNRPNYLVNQISTTGIFKNLNLIVNFDNEIERSTFNGLINVNYGTIENIFVSTYGITDVPNITFSAIGASNYGTLKKFVIHQVTPLHGERNLALGFINNYKDISDGYLYGEKIDASYKNMTATNKRVAGLVAYAATNTNIQNVFSLINIDSYTEKSTHYGTSATNNETIVGNIIAEQVSGNTSNTYSIGEGNIVGYANGPSIGVASNSGLRNNYYISDNMYTNTYNLKLSPLSPHDIEFQKRALNSNSAFIIDKYVDTGYFPQIDFPDCMPNQDLIELNTVEEKDLLDITNSEVIENKDNEAIINFTVNNPSGEVITDIKIQDVDVEIQDQTYASGKSIVTARVYNPKTFVSRYYVSSISSRGAYSLTNTRNFETNERPLFFDMYKEISTISEFNDINNKPTENYILKNDLDFSNNPNTRISKTYSGKFNGNNYTLKNITITSGNPIFYTVSGSISNLFVENYRLESTPNYAGLIYSTTRTTVLENIHIKNEYITGYNRLGGLIAVASGGEITNCSVSNIEFSVKEDSNSIYLGGFIGTSDYTTIRNCYVRGLKVSLSNLYSTSGVGGFIGYLNQSILENIYTEGNIKTDYRTTGGIIGYGVGNTTITNAISNVDILATGNYVGGIAGRSSFTTASNLLYLGNTYSNNNVNYIHRISGSQQLSSNTYANRDRLFNGKYYDEVNENNSLYVPTYGEVLVPFDELKTKTFYQMKLGFDQNWNYDNVTDDIMPKLNYYGTDKLLPNQEDIKFISDIDRTVEIVEMDKKAKSIDIVVNIKNPDELEVTKIDFDYLDYIKFSRYYTENGLTQITLSLTPNRYYDTYKLLGVHLNNNGNDEYIEANLKISAEMYKTIDSVSEWNKIDPNTFENYIITKDLDFNNDTKTLYNVNVNRIVGAKDNQIGSKVTFKNITFNFNKALTALVNQVSMQLTDIDFENVNISNTATSGNYTGIFGLVYGDVNNMNFKNIEINAPKVSYVGIFANSGALSFKNVMMDHINVAGNSYTGGLSGNGGTVQNCVVATNIDIKGGSRSGAISGQGGSNNFIVDNAHVTGTDYSGVAFGNLNITSTYGTSYGCNAQINDKFKEYVDGNTKFINNDNIYTGKNIIQNSNVSGTSRVGGAIGNGGTLNNTTVNDVEIKSTSTYIGGIGGVVTSTNPIVMDTNINKDTPSTSSYVGGISGSGGTISNSKVVNMEINANGNNVGGISGNSSSINTSRAVNITINSNANNIGGIVGNTTSAVTNSYAYNCLVNGNSNVGGIAGNISYGANITNNYNNTIVSANGNNVGGVVGNVTNANMTLLSNRIYVRNNMALRGSISGVDYVGGIIGKSDKDINDLYYAFHSYILAENIYATGNKENINALIGSNNTDISTIKNFKVYNNALINDNNINNYDDKLSEENLVTSNDLLNQSTYVDMTGSSSAYYSFPTNIWNYTPLSDGYFPTITNTSPDGNYIEVFDDENRISLFNNKILLKSYIPNKSASLPNVDIYPSDVDKINIEFEDEPNYVYISINGKEIYDLKRVNTFTYNYKDNLKIIVSNGYREKTYNIKPDKFNIKASVYKDKYYLIDNNKLITNGIQKLNNYKFIHLYKNMGITDNNEIINLENGNIIKTFNHNIELIDTIPLNEFIYNDYTIKTFYNYSLSNNNEINNILLVKNNILEVLDPNIEFNRNSIIIDNYSNNSYTTILGNDNKIYNLKKDIKLPNNFINKNIKYMTNNLYTDSNYIVVIYENNDSVIFDYTNGNIIYKSNTNGSLSLISYIKSIFDKNTNLINDNIYNSYNESRILADKVNNISIDDALEKLKEDKSSKYYSTKTNNENKYVSMYNNFSKKYELYNIDDLLNKSDVKSVDNLINSNMHLLSYYSIPNKIFKNSNNLGTIIVIIIFILITAGVGYLVLFRKEKI